MRLLSDEGKTPEAIKELKDILDSTAKKTYDPAQKSSRARMLEELGNLYRKNDQVPQAVETFREIGAMDPDVCPSAVRKSISINSDTCLACVPN